MGIVGAGAFLKRFCKDTEHQPFGELVLNAPEFIGLFVLPILLYRRLWLLPFSATLYVLGRLA
jgi:hypothetical protein